MYATQGFSDVPDVHKDFPKREQNLIQVDGQKMTPHASLYMLAKPSESSFRTTKEYRVVQTPFTVRGYSGFGGGNRPGGVLNRPGDDPVKGRDGPIWHIVCTLMDSCGIRSDLELEPRC